MTTALVIGAGVGGPVAALALRRVGVDATVYERRAPDDSDCGAFLTLQINGIDALRAVGLDAAVTGLGFPTASIRLRSGTGAVLGEVGTGAPLPDGTVAVTLRRSDLHEVLRAAAARHGVPVEYGRRLVDVRRTAGGVRAEFDDGSTAVADLLIGADGLRSRVRTLIDPAAPPARYVPVLNTGGFAPPQPTDATPGRFEMIFGRRAFFGYGTAPDGVVWWFANPPRRAEPTARELAATDPAAWRAELLDLFADDAGPACAIIGSTPGDLPVWPTYDLPRVPRWHGGAMVLVGDAAHATSPSSGQGASMAVEDAVELARCLRDAPDAESAFRAYEGLRRERVERVVRAGARTSNQKAAGPVGRVVRDALLPLGLRLAARNRQEWLHHHHVDWDAPVLTGR